MNESSKICELCEMFDTDLKMPQKYYALGDRIEESKNKIIKNQNMKRRKKIKKQLEIICNDYEEMNCIEDDKYFIYGFSLAVQIMGEAFSMKIQ